MFSLRLIKVYRSLLIGLLGIASHQGYSESITPEEKNIIVHGGWMNSKWGFDLEEVKHKRIEGTNIDFSAGELSYPTNLTSDRGDYLQYKGGAIGGCVVYGPYRRLGVAGLNYVEGHLDMEFTIYPDTYETCRERNWKSECVGWDTHFRDHGFTIDLTYNVGKNVLDSRKISNVQRGDRMLWDVSGRSLTIDGAIENVEVRVCGLYGGRFDIRVYGSRLFVGRER